MGNPGLRYKFTKHNMGFLVIDKLAKAHSIRMRRGNFTSLTGRGRIEGVDVIMAKPLTYMNLSGPAVAGIVAKEDVQLNNVMVVYDDADLPLGSIRIRPKGSAGGHKGIKSIIENLRTEEFPRLRIGIGREQRDGLTSHVLAPFKKKDLKLLEDTLEEAAQALYTWINGGIHVAMNKFNA